MQAISPDLSNVRYDCPMQTGRPSRHPRTSFGERLHTARETAGLSQSQVAEKMKVIQSTYSDWERYPIAIRPDQIEKLAEILNVSVDYLFGKETSTSRQNGPVGKLRRVFEEASQLPRNQQSKVAEFVEGFVKLHNSHRQAA